MANGVQKCPQGPFWPMGNIAVTTPGTPVQMTSLVDPTGVNDPNNATSAQANEYTVRAQQIMIQGMKSNAGNGLINNTGNIYVIQKGSPSPGTNNRSDTGAIIACVPAGQTLFLASAPMNRNVFCPYRLYIDADNANDGAQVMLIIQ